MENLFGETPLVKLLLAFAVLAMVIPTVGTIWVGAVSSFVVAALVLAIVFLLIEIADNTRKTAIFFNQLVSRAQA